MITEEIVAFIENIIEKYKSELGKTDDSKAQLLLQAKIEAVEDMLERLCDANFSL